MLPSVQLYSVRDALAADPLGTLQQLRESGFERVEPFDLAGHATMLADGLAQTGLEAPSTHASLLAAEDPASVFATARDLGIGTVIDPFWNPDDWASEEGVRSVARRLNELAPIAARHGVRLGYHNHAFECATDFEGRTGLELLVEHLDPAVVLELDTYWAAVAGVDPAALLRSLGERVRLVHLKDGPIEADTSTQLPLGEGAMDLPALLGAAPWLELGVIEFDDYAGDVLDGVAQSLEHLGRVDASGQGA